MDIPSEMIPDGPRFLGSDEEELSLDYNAKVAVCERIEEKWDVEASPRELSVEYIDGEKHVLLSDPLAMRIWKHHTGR